MSHIEGIDALKAKFTRFEHEVVESVEEILEPEVKRFRDEVVSLVPIDQGDGREALLDPSALRVQKSPDGHGKRIVYGLNVPALARRAFHLFFVEFGTKGYMRRESRKAGKTKSGKQRWRRMKRPVPPRPAQPFWRPAEANLWRRLETRLNLFRILAAAKHAAGFADRQ